MTTVMIANSDIDPEFLANYFKTMVNHFFKILPMRENEDPSLQIYLQSFQSELLGCKELIESLDADPQFITLLAILQYLIDTPEVPFRSLRREVFRAISICNKMRAKYVTDCDEVRHDERLG